MRIGFIGSGNMARALALAFGAPALFCDSGSGRAARLAAETGGEAVSLEQLINQSDCVFLCHKPRQLAEVSAHAKGFDGTVVSVLAATSLSSLREVYPAARVVRTMPNIPVAQGEGVVAIAEESDAAPELDGLFERCGLTLRIPEAQFEVVTAIAGCAPAFFARFAGALISSAVDRGIDPELASVAVNQTLVGTGAALAANGVDTEGLMRAVASPGGLTERALESFEQSQLADAVDRAVATVLGQ